MQNHFNDVQDLPIVGEMRATDLTQTAALHIEQLGRCLFPRLGNVFVQRWHRAFVLSPHGVAIAVRTSDGELAGFLIGSTDQGLFMREVLRQHRGPLVWRGALGLVGSPVLPARLARMRGARYARRLARGTKPASLANPCSPPMAVVHAVITRPGFRRQGVGTILLSLFERAVADNGIQVIQLATQADGGAVEFFRALGWNETALRRDKDGIPVVQFDREVRSI